MLHVLFVDDEPLILDSLRDVLHYRRREWRMRFLTTAGEALDVLAAEPIDVVVTDLRMPVMDGYALLHKISRLHATVIRIVLSGTPSDDLTVGMMPIAHAVLCKPCDPIALEEAINRGYALTRGHPLNQPCGVGPAGSSRW